MEEAVTPVTRPLNTMSLYQEYEADFEDFHELAEAINKTRKALFTATEKLNKAEAKARACKARWDREFRRVYLTSSQRTEQAKKEYALLMTEDFEDEYILYDQVSRDLQRSCQAIRQDLDILQVLSHNLRQQLKMLGG